MKPQELYFCLHSVEELNLYEKNDGNKNKIAITFCPIIYWQENKHLPDSPFGDEIDNNLLPKEYEWSLYVEETQWVSEKSKEEIREELTSLGFVENKDLEKFLTSCNR